MLIRAGTRPEDLRSTGLRHWANDRFWIGWKGHLYRPGRDAGAASIASLAAELATMPLARTVGQLRGVYGVFVYDRQDGTWQIGSDHLGFYRLYYDQDVLGTKLLELMTDRGYGPADLDRERLVEFLVQAVVFGPATVVKGVRRLVGEEVLIGRADDAGGPFWRAVPKHLSETDSDDPDIVIGVFKDLAASLSGRKVAVDVTGGFNSRLIACLFAQFGLPFEVGVTGRDMEAPDIAISEIVAKTLGRDSHPLLHDTSWLETEIEAVFQDSDGQLEMRTIHRDWQNAVARLGRNVEVIAHGGAGGVLKDFAFSHEFPWYGSKRFDPTRYYDLRVVPLRIPRDHLTDEAASWVAAARQRMLDRCEQYRSPTNNESCDRIAFFVRNPESYGGYFSTYLNMGLDVVIPFADIDVAAVGRRMPPWSRFMNRWHRHALTASCPAAAALITTDGFNASTEPRYLLPNLFGWTRNAARRALRKTSQRVLGREMFTLKGNTTANAADYMPRLRASGAFKEAVARLRSEGILARDLSEEMVRDSEVPRILTLGLLLAHADRCAR